MKPFLNYFRYIVESVIDVGKTLILSVKSSIPVRTLTCLAVDRVIPLSFKLLLVAVNNDSVLLLYFREMLCEFLYCLFLGSFELLGLAFLHSILFQPVS